MVISFCKLKVLDFVSIKERFSMNAFFKFFSFRSVKEELSDGIKYNEKLFGLLLSLRPRVATIIKDKEETIIKINRNFFYFG